MSSMLGWRDGNDGMDPGIHGYVEDVDLPGTIQSLNLKSQIEEMEKTIV